MDSVYRLCFPLVAALALSACGASPDEHYAKAQAAFAVQDFDTARVELAAGLQAEPGDIRMLGLLAQSQLRLEDPDGAMMTIGRLRAAGAKGPAITRFAAEAQLLAGKPAAALDLLGSDPAPDAWRLRARAQLALARPGEAIASFERGVAAGDDARLLADYIWFTVSANDLPAAERLLQRLRGFAPDAMETLILSGDVAMRRGRLDLALPAYRRAAKLYPARFQPHVSEAELYEQFGDLDKAQKAAQEADAIEPGHPIIAALQLRLAGKAGRWGEIRGTLQGREDKLDPQSPGGQLYAEALLRLGQPEQARTILGRTVLMQPGNRHARRLLGEALLAGGDAGQAYETLAPLAEGMLVMPDELALVEKAARAAKLPQADALKARLDSPAFRRIGQAGEAGEIALRKGDWPAAVAAYRSLLPLGDDPVILANLSYALRQSGQAAEAVPIADRAVALAPDDPVILKVAAMARLDAGADQSEAARLLRRAQAGAPADPEIAVLLKKAGG